MSGTVEKNKIEIQVPRVLIISFENSPSESLEIINEHPSFKGEHVVVVKLSGTLGESSKDWRSGFAKNKLDQLASFCVDQVLKETNVSANWLSPSEIIRASKDNSVRGMVIASEFVSNLRIKGNSGNKISSFPKNEFLDLVMKYLV